MQYNQERLTSKTVTQVDMLKVMDNYKRSVDYFNSYGITSNKGAGTGMADAKKPLGEANK